MRLENMTIPFMRVLLIAGMIATLKPEKGWFFLFIFLVFIVFEWIAYEDLLEQKKQRGRR